MRPRFRHGEVVRIARLADGWPEEQQWVLGEEGVADEVAAPTRSGGGWTVLVWISEPEPQGRVLWVFDEDELESLGWVELDGGERVPAATVPPPDELHDELHVWLMTDIVDAGEATRVAAEMEQALNAIVPDTRLALAVERHWHEPHVYEFQARIDAGDLVEALRRLVLAGGRWRSDDDDGWRVDLWWEREGEQLFLAGEVAAAAVAYEPWDDSRRRPEAARPLVAVPLTRRTDETG